MNAQILVCPYELVLNQKRGNLWKGFSNSKREQFEIMAEMLLSCRKGQGKTKLMYAANLNYPQLQKYSEILTSRGLLASEGRKYVTTEKGSAFLEIFASMMNLLTDKR